ncbi:MAG: beta-galactosidase [Schleiferilactobacillus harbinensis]|jgi:beta-galactosidase|nr:beta-galactosidase [Schleiferilactobacillus harbinensis]MCI1911403.1 beta-galactosidase [Schleiferilactobacillus harbinensis]
MIKTDSLTFEIDGQPTTILAGEVHYFRLPPFRWQSVLTELKAAGMNTLSTYIPWLVHEEQEGVFDFTGQSDERHNLKEFINLVHQNGLYLIARPGPFNMAELKNEGIPFWVRDKYPAIIPTSWHGQTVPTGTVDYTNSDFKQAAQNWLQAVCQVLAPALQAHGGPIIGVQLDNEVGMLSWISNAPDLTDTTIAEFSAWLQNKYHDQLPAVYPADFLTATRTRQYMEEPDDAWVLQYQNNLGHYMRYRFKNYLAFLADTVRDAGIVDTPLLINVHGTDQGRGETFPIGISQLYDTFDLKDVVIGTDVYFGDFDMTTATHLYTLNRFMQSVDGDWPLTTLEFNASSGNNDDHLPMQIEASALPLKTRLQLAQGTKMINDYLFTGGFNRSLAVPVADGNSRIGIHGYRHGFGSLLSPEGKSNYTLPAMAQVGNIIKNTDSLLASMHSVTAPISVGFIPDDYMTEYHYPQSQVSDNFVADQETNRATLPWNNIFLNLLSAKYNYDAWDLQKDLPTHDNHHVLVVPTGQAMPGTVQQRLLDYVNKGGQLLLQGELPVTDLTGQPDTTLINGLGLMPLQLKRESVTYFPTITHHAFAEGLPEVRIHQFQSFEPTQRDSIVFWRELESNAAVGALFNVGRGQVAFLGSEGRFDPAFYKLLLNQFEVTPQLTLTPAAPFVLAFVTQSNDGTLIHLLNTLDVPTTFTLHSAQERTLFGGYSISIGAKQGLILAMDTTVAAWQLAYSTAEIINLSSHQVSFSIKTIDTVIALTDQGTIMPSDDFWTEKQAETTILHPRHTGSFTLYREGDLTIGSFSR